MSNFDLEDAFNSMLRTDYIALGDTEKLNLLADYYVDYLGYVSQIVGPTDQLIVGRRGTGKTTLLYRALVECMRSWGPRRSSSARPRTLGVYLDLEKCQSLSSTSGLDYENFEYAFVAELCDAIKEELYRSWPDLARQSTLLDRAFRAAQSRKANAVNAELAKLAEILRSGLPRFVNRSGPVQIKETSQASKSAGSKLTASLQASKAGLTGEIGNESSESQESEATRQETISYRLSVADLLRVIRDLRVAAEVPHFIIFIDEFSSLQPELQGRFTTLLKKILGNHSGVYIKLCAITDNYRLGSSIILQRDLFEVSLDLDAFVERSGSLTTAMVQLERLTREIIEQRLDAYNAQSAERVFESAEYAFTELTRSAMGVPRTMGIVLKQAWSRSSSRGSGRVRIRVTDIDYGVRYASKAYLNQMIGAARDGFAIPEHVVDMWDSLLERAANERRKSEANRRRRNSVPSAEGERRLEAISSASHFMVVPRFEEYLKYFNMFFLVHLLTQGRTTKKESVSRSLYCFDYGTALENNLGWADDKNIIRQQRFAYDNTLAEFDRFYRSSQEEEYQCPRCGATYLEEQLMVAGIRLDFCPRDREQLRALLMGRSGSAFTEEEIKIAGAIRSAGRENELLARQVADDVGCPVQKVANFGAKLDRDGVIEREKPTAFRNYIYYGRKESGH
jgi:hypothetical protein